LKFFKQHLDSFYFFLSLGFLIGLTCSKFLMSVSLILHALIFILAGNYVLFIKRLQSNQWLFLLLAFWGIHALSLLWTSDLHEGWNALRVRISMVSLPLLYIGTLPFNPRVLNRYVLILMLTITVVISLNVLHYWYLQRQNLALDIRQLSWFGSHIRFGILVVFSGILAFNLWKNKLLSTFWLMAYLVLIGMYTLYSQTLSAYISALFVLLVIAYDVIKPTNYSRIIGVGVIVFIGVLGALIINIIATPSNTCGSFTSSEEAIKAWSLRSDLPMDLLDRKGQRIMRTAERYLCDKGESLTGKSIQNLSQQDILNIENGFTSEHSARGGLLSRIEEIRFELHEATDPNNHSLLQRLEYWKTALAVINDHPLIGVGIGDINREMNNKYKETGSLLTPENRHRSHNMYLTTWMGVGVLGILIMLWGIGYFGWIGYKEHQPMLLAFCAIVFTTMCLEDSFETQAGSSFVGFFIALLCGREGRAAWTTKNY